MAEDALKENSGTFTRRQMWKHLPKKIAYKKFCLIVDYFIATNKITVDRRGGIVWIWDPKLLNKYLSRKNLMWKRE